MDVAKDLIQSIYAKIRLMGLPIGHLKFIIDDGIVKQKISYTASTTTSYAGITNYACSAVSLLINARVQTTPGVLKEIVSTAIAEISRGGTIIEEIHSKSFKPGFPTPQYRMG
jgi:hypothetical protein